MDKISEQTLLHRQTETKIEHFLSISCQYSIKLRPDDIKSEDICNLSMSFFSMFYFCLSDTVIQLLSLVYTHIYHIYVSIDSFWYKTENVREMNHPANDDENRDRYMQRRMGMEIFLFPIFYRNYYRFTIRLGRDLFLTSTHTYKHKTNTKYCRYKKRRATIEHFKYFLLTV